MAARFTCLTLFVFTAFVVPICEQPVTKSLAQQLPPQDPPAVEEDVTFIAVGDIMLSRGVARAIARSNDPHLPFSRVSHLLSSTDFNFGNLETPFSGNDRITGKGLVFNARRSDLEGLAANNFKILNLANNHALDQNALGLRKTRKYLEARGISYLGVGENQSEAWQPRIISVRNVRIGFVGASYTSFNDGGTRRNQYIARIEDEEKLRLAISRLRSDADFIVVTMHAGIEYVRRPSPSQSKFARAAIDYGADIVIGAHPHWIQTVEYYKGRCIYYSLGNFIFDQGFSRETKEGLMIKVSLATKREGEDAQPNGVSHSAGTSNNRREVSLKRIELIPIVIENRSTPRPATDVEAQRILKKIAPPSQCTNPDPTAH